MKKYTVEWYGAETESAKAFDIEAANVQEAYGKAVELFARWQLCKAYPGMRISSE